ncbi:MAG: DUF2505 family protein [Myxococcota bacterium]|nr:DUF2505 family protein [Myxococcota bacterium]
MKESIQDDFAISAGDFFSRVYLDADYTRALHLDGMKCVSYEVIMNKGDVLSGLERSIRSVPNVEMPKAVQKVLGNSIAYTEVGYFDSEAQNYRFKVLPSTLQEKIRIEGLCSVEALDETCCRRICDLEFEVKVFGVGKLIEQVIRNSYVENQKLAATFTAAWIAKHRG